MPDSTNEVAKRMREQADAARGNGFFMDLAPADEIDRLQTIKDEMRGVLVRFVRRVEEGERITPDLNIVSAARRAIAADI